MPSGARGRVGWTCVGVRLVCRSCSEGEHEISGSEMSHRRAFTKLENLFK